MLADPIEPRAVSSEAGSTPHGLAPVLVADGDEVDELVRTARAGVAVLSLHLRNARREADAAARQSSTWDLDAATRLLTSTMELQTSARRLEMAKELEAARADAARLVLEARAEAAGSIEAAGEQVLSVLLAGTSTSRGPTHSAVVPNLRVVADTAVTSAPLADEEPVAVAATPVDDHPVWVAAPRQDAPAPAPAPVAAAVPIPVSEPVAPPPVLAVDPVTPAPSAETLTATAAPPATPLTDERRSRSRVARFLYVDVLLPMIAVLVLLVVLLAWVG